MHTKGPWKWVDMPIIRELFNGCSAICSEHIDDAVIATIGEDVPGHEANAHLIAAAPQLLEALKACHLQMLQSNNDSEYAQEANQLAIAAIAKAEGKE